jgi:hypothetical protein
VEIMAIVRQLKFRHGLLFIGCAAALVGVPSSELQGQVVQLRPVADLSLPTRVSLRDGVIHVRQKVGMTFGARMTLTFSDRFDVVTAVTYSPGSATLHGAGKQIELASSGHTLGASTGARYWLRPPGGKFSWELHSGFGLVFGGQPAYEDLFESSTVSAVLGCSMVYHLGRIVSLKLRVQERLFRLRFGNLDSGRSKRPLQVSFGLGLPFLESLR